MGSGNWHKQIQTNTPNEKRRRRQAAVRPNQRWEVNSDMALLLLGIESTRAAWGVNELTLFAGGALPTNTFYRSASFRDSLGAVIC